MNHQDLLLRDRLAAIAEDAPSEASVMATVQTGYRHRLHRKRWYATGSVVAVVLLVAGATTLVGAGVAPSKSAMSSQTDLMTVGMRATPTVVPLGSDTRLVPFAGFTVQSPVTVPRSSVSFDSDGPDVTTGNGYIEVNWTGAGPTAVQTVDDNTGQTGSGHYRGYLVTGTAPPVEVSASGTNTKASSTTITLEGHTARLLTAPKGAYDSTYQTPAAQRIVWQLADGRWIQVWAVGEDTSVLTSFASSITEQKVIFPATVSVGITLKGYTSANWSGKSYVSQMAGPNLKLCPVSAPAMPDYATCLSIEATVADGGFLAGVIGGSETNAKFNAMTKVLEVGGIRVSVHTDFQVAWTKWGAATILVMAPADSGLSAQQLAQIAASVRLSPSMQVRNEPDAMVQSSLKQYPQETVELTG